MLVDTKVIHVNSDSARCRSEEPQGCGEIPKKVRGEGVRRRHSKRKMGTLEKEDRMIVKRWAVEIKRLKQKQKQNAVDRKIVFIVPSPLRLTLFSAGNSVAQTKHG